MGTRRRGPWAHRTKSMASSRWVDDEQGVPTACGHRMRNTGAQSEELAGSHGEGLSSDHQLKLAVEYHQGFVMKVDFFVDRLGKHAQHFDLSIAQWRDDAGTSGLRQSGRFMV